MAIITTIPMLFGIIFDIPLVISIAILTFFLPVSTYYLGLVLMARAKSKKEEEEREKITFTGY
ncbi:MAG: hypothetical protein BME94_03295 [Methanobacteriales archaeon Met13]